MATPKKETQPPSSPKPHSQDPKGKKLAHKNDPVVATETPTLELARP